MTPPSSLVRWIAFALTLVGYCTLAAYVELSAASDVSYIHLAYIPISLAGIWWGWRAVGIAAGLGVVTLGLGVARQGSAALAVDGLAVILFLAVAILIALLRQEGLAWWHRFETRNRLLVDRSIAGILVYRDDRILFANRRIGEMVGLPPPDLEGRSIWGLIHEEDRARVREALAAEPDGQGPDRHFECRLVPKEDSPIWVTVAWSEADYGGQPAALVSAYDITEKKRAEAQRMELRERSSRQELQIAHATRLAELGEMAAMIAHELNQPLTGIRTLAGNAIYMIQHQVGSPGEVSDNLNRITQQVDRAASVINHVRELTRKTEPHLAPLDVNRVVVKAVDFLSAQFRLANIRVDLCLCDDLPPILGHGVRLEQVLLNLLSNAKHAMRDSPDRRLKVRTFLAPDDPRPVGIEITDTGEGFDPRNREKLFRPFYSTKDAGHGTGLGLSISSTTVKEHKGKIEATGSPGKGATFTIRLPVHLEAKGEEGGGKR